MPPSAGAAAFDVARAGAAGDAADWQPDAATVIAIAVVAYGTAISSMKASATASRACWRAAVPKR